MRGFALTLALFGSAQGSESARPVATEVRDCEQCPPLVLMPLPRGSGGTLAISRHELTWREYIPSVVEASCPLPLIEDERKRYPADVSVLADDLPLTGVPPTRIGCYLDWLKRKTGRTYRLPTAAEWVHAARAGTTTTFPWGDEIGFNNAAIATRYADKREPSFWDVRPWVRTSTIAVEQFRPNAWGLYDVVGNVAEYMAESRPGDAGCIARKDEATCRRQEIRGGGRLVVSIRPGVGEVVQPDPIGIPRYTFAGVSQPIGYRLVRE